MSEDAYFKRVFALLFALLVSVVLIFGGVIGSNLLTTKWTKDLIQTSLEKGQNPMYAKCAMQGVPTADCTTMMTIISITKVDK